MAQWAITGQRIRRIKYTQLLQLLFRVYRWSARMHLVLDRRTNNSDVGGIFTETASDTWRRASWLEGRPQPVEDRSINRANYQNTHTKCRVSEASKIDGASGEWKMLIKQTTLRVNQTVSTTVLAWCPGRNFWRLLTISEFHLCRWCTHKSIRRQHLLLSTPVSKAMKNLLL